MNVLTTTHNTFMEIEFTYSISIKEAIEKAGYKYPESDRTWFIILDIQEELLNEYVLYN